MPDVQELNEGLSMQMASMQVLAEKWSDIKPKHLRGYETSKRDKIDFLEGIDNDLDRCHLAQLLENTHRYLNGLDESTRMANVGSYEKFLYPIIRALYANLVTKDLVTVYPLQTPSGTVFNA